MLHHCMFFGLIGRNAEHATHHHQVTVYQNRECHKHRLWFGLDRKPQQHSGYTA